MPTFLPQASGGLGGHFRSRLKQRPRPPRWLRAVAIAGLLTAAATLALALFSPAEPPTLRIPVARVGLAPGHVITEHDLTWVDFAPGSLPDTVVRDLAQLTGRLTARDVDAGLPLTKLDVQADIRHMSHGEAITYVSLPSAEFARTLHPGSHLKLAFPPGSPAQTVSSCAAPVIVLFSNTGAEDSADALFSPENGTASSIVIKTSEACAVNLAFIPDLSMIRVVLVPDQQTSNTFP
ncbi:SAF domain-containing protein [Micrococcales bacterium 31B]|nr:SAF domain-containing protein [Micrococcales bacterium 31B]